MDAPEVADESETEAVHVLIRRCAYREAVDEASNRMGAEIGRFCQAMLGDETQAREVVLDVLVRFHDVLPTLETAPLRPWLFGCAYRLCVQRLTMQTPEEREAAIALTREDDRRLPIDAEQQREQARQTRHDLEGVSAKARGAALLRYCARLGYADIASICGITEGEAGKQTGRALLALRDATTGTGEQ